MSYVDSIGNSNTASSATSTTSNSGLNQLDNTQTFLDLLVTQLKNQDPDNPTDPTSFMTEIAQLTSVESQTSLDADEETAAANSMIGENVAGTNSSGQDVVGTVAGVLLSSSGAAPTLLLANDGGTLSLSSVVAVYGSGADPASSSTTSSQS